MKTFLNLSNGIERVNEYEWDGFVRIQSSHLEKAHWEEVLSQLDSNFLMWVANGPVRIIDGAGSSREDARACWQGIPWITYALERTWFNRRKHTVICGKYNVTDYFESVCRELTKKTLKKLKYFRTYLTIEEVQISYECFRSTIDDKKDIHKKIWLNHVKQYPNR